MMNNKRDAFNLHRVICNFLQRKDIWNKNAPWTIQKSTLGGFGVFATKDIEVGEVIFRDFPVILGPRALKTCPFVCIGCYSQKNPKLCSKRCGLPVCSEICEKGNHQRECKLVRRLTKDKQFEECSSTLLKCFTPFRSLLMSDEDKELVNFLKAHRGSCHGHEIDTGKNELGFDLKEDEEQFVRFVCSVMDTNAFEVLIGNEDNQSNLRGLYPLGSIVNHSCVPNAMHVFDESNLMIVKAAVFITKGSELFHTYSRLIWGTSTRIYHLYRTKHFVCRCVRCSDSTEFGTYMNAFLCKVCKGNVVPVEPLKSKTIWRCVDCQSAMNSSEIARKTSLCGSILSTLSSDDFDIMIKFLQNSSTIVSSNNQIIVELKYKIIWILGHHDLYLWGDLTDSNLCVKETFCKELLSLLEQLRLGQCKMRGLLLYELFCTLKEKQERSLKTNPNKQVENNVQLLQEASDILLYDVTAPEEIKKIWRLH